MRFTLKVSTNNKLVCSSRVDESVFPVHYCLNEDAFSSSVKNHRPSADRFPAGEMWCIWSLTGPVDGGTEQPTKC